MGEEKGIRTRRGEKRRRECTLTCWGCRKKVPEKFSN